MPARSALAHHCHTPTPTPQSTLDEPHTPPPPPPRPGAQAPGLDPRFHYVINGAYVSVIEGGVWVVALGIKDALPDKGGRVPSWAFVLVDALRFRLGCVVVVH